MKVSQDGVDVGPPGFSETGPLAAPGRWGCDWERDRNGMMTFAASLAQAQRVIRLIVASRHDRPSLVAEIACEVGAQIVETMIAPGHDLNTVELARRYRTSRTPVREALILLENQGLVDILPRRRPRAHVHTMGEVSEIFRTRTALFELMANELATKVADDHIEPLQGIVAEMKVAAETGDVTAFSWLSLDFHDNETRASGNQTAKRIHDSLLLRTLALRRISLSHPGRMAQSLENHIQLVKAYENHDPNLASALLRANYSAALGFLLPEGPRGGGSHPEVHGCDVSVAVCE
jgi:DNA-binding GntR family transcriptional regulator